MKPTDIIKKVELLKSDRANWESYWQTLARFCLPKRAYITRNRVEGEQLDFHQIFDNVAIRALQTMAAGFGSHLTNPSSKWFSLSTKNQDIMRSKATQKWFKSAEEEMFSTLATSNFESIMQEFYQGSGCFGTGAIFSEEDFKTRVRFTMIPIEELFIEEDAKGRVNRVYRKFEYTALQAFERWGKDSGEAVAELMKEKNPNSMKKKLTFIHSVVPRETRDPSKEDNMNMPFESKWTEVSKKQTIREGGFREMPYHVGRFNKETGQVWGFSPAMNVLADIKMVNKMKQTLIRAAMKIVDPPFIVPHRGFVQPLNFNPSGANYSKDQKPSDAYHSIDTRANIPIGMDLIQRVSDDIEKGFFVPVFQAFIDITKAMSVPEVRQRIAENMTLLGPVVGRFTQEVFDPMITRVFLILLRTGVLPPPPEETIDQDLDITYISALAKAQRNSEIQEIQSFLGDVSAISQVLPEVIDKIDGDETIDIIAKIRRVNPDLLRDDEVVKAIREQRAAVAEQQARMNSAEQLAGTLKDGASADKDLRE